MNVNTSIDGKFFSSTPVRPWSSGNAEPLISFCTDDGKIYCSQFHHLSAVLDESNQQLDVKAPPHGTIVICGSFVGELCEALCTHRATKIRKCEPEIASVTFIPDEESVAL
jgi:hypothetical protein